MSLLKLMHVFPAHEMLLRAEWSGVALRAAQDHARPDAPTPIRLHEMLNRAEQQLGELERVLHAAQLRPSYKVAMRTKAAVDKVRKSEQIGPDLEVLYTLHREMIRRLHDDLEDRIVLMVDVSDMELCDERSHLFGDAVLQRFPKTAKDVAEAGKCLAAGRYTACVMHLMRALELVLKKIRANTNAKNAHDWGGIIKNINIALTEKAGAFGPRTSRATRVRHRFYSEALERFARIKDVRRNPSMHAGRIFDEHEARGLYAATRDFTVYMAEGMRGKKKKK